MPPLLNDHNHYGMYEKEKYESPSEDDEDMEYRVDLRPPVDPRSRVSELGFLVGSILTVAGFILFWTHFLMDGAKVKFEHGEADAEASHDQKW